MKTIIRIAFVLALALSAHAQIFTNIYFPGSWPNEQWWTNASPPASIVTSNAWLAENENWRRASNAFTAIDSRVGYVTNAPERLTVGGAGLFTGASSRAGAAAVTGITIDYSGGVGRIASANWAQGYYPLSFQSDTITFGVNNGTAAERMRIDGATGFVGINTNSPAVTLDVLGNARVSGTMAVGSITNNASGGSAVAFYDPNKKLVDATAANIVSAIGATPVQRATADASGNTISSTYLTQSARPAIICGNTGNSAVAAPGTYYACPSGMWTNVPTSDTSGFTRIVLPYSVTINSLYVIASAAQGAGKSMTVTLQDNGSDSSVVATLNNATSGYDTTHTLSLAAGHELGLRIVLPSGGVAAKVSWGIGMR